jgi:hypothetical protein
MAAGSLLNSTGLHLHPGFGIKKSNHFIFTLRRILT